MGTCGELTLSLVFEIDIKHAGSQLSEALPSRNPFFLSCCLGTSSASVPTKGAFLCSVMAV